MKKWLLLLGLSLNFGGLCYGMDEYKQKAIQKRIEEDRKIFESRKWYAVSIILHLGDPEEKEAMQELLLAQSSEVLNDMSATDQADKSLFDNLLDRYISEKKRRWERPENYKNDPPKTGPILKKLILKGLDFRVKINGRYAYSYDSRDNPEARDLSRYVWFLELFHELMQENPNEATRLCAGFEGELSSYDQLLENRGEQPKFRTWLKPVRQEPLLEKAVEKPVLVTTDKQPDPGQAQTKLDKSDELNVFQRIKMPAIYSGIGVIVLAAACIIYEKCIKKTLDNDEEQDENQQEESDPDTTKAQRHV